MEKEKVLKDLQNIPGVGKSISKDLYKLGISQVSDLKNRDPEILYTQLCDLAGGKVDRCMLYVFKCAVYYASNKNHDDEKLKWWNWKD